MESEHGNENSKHPTMATDSSHENGNSMVKGNVSRSSSSSSSSFDPLIDSDDDEKDRLGNSIKKFGHEGPSSQRTGAVLAPEASPAQTPEWSMISASPRGGPGPLSSPEADWSMLTASPKQSPPVQTMGRSIPGYDPNRIPSSIFNSRPATPMEWSVASNESLFSIHMGNNSFSRDHVINMSKSGELTKLDELTNSTSKLNEPNISPSSLPTVNEVPVDSNHGKSASMMEEDLGGKEAENERVKETEEERQKKESMPSADGVRFSASASNVSDAREVSAADGARTSASTSRLSDESGNSSSSFAFPVLAAGEGVRTSSVKVAPETSQAKPLENPPPQPQAQEVTPLKQAETRWYSCFCCPQCC